MARPSPDAAYKEGKTIVLVNGLFDQRLQTFPGPSLPLLAAKCQIPVDLGIHAEKIIRLTAVRHILCF